MAAGWAKGGQRGQRGERGAALVEFAVLLPLSLLIVFGIIEFGIAYNGKISVNQGVREGARQAVVADYGTGCGTGGAAIQCITKKRTGLDPSLEAVRVLVPDGDVEGKAVTVCAQYPVNAITPLMQPFLGGKVIEGKATMRIEKGDGTLTEYTGDAAIGGTDWSWCA